MAIVPFNMGGRYSRNGRGQTKAKEPSQIEVFEGPGGLEAFAFEGTRARSRNKDGKNVPDATKAFKTVACLKVTLAHAKIGCAALVVGSSPIVVV